MKPIVTIVAALAVLGTAQAGEVFVTKDAQGQPIYTDRPESLPAQKMKIASKSHGHRGRAERATTPR